MHISFRHESRHVVFLARVEPTRDAGAARRFDFRFQRRELVRRASTGKNRIALCRKLLRNRAADIVAGADDGRRRIPLDGHERSSP